ncbi:MAG: phosphatase PAP2 family protein [Ilumatobacteraceae bacterium]
MPDASPRSLQKRFPIDRHGLGRLVGAWFVLTATFSLVGAAINRWWEPSRFGRWDASVNRWFGDHRTDSWTSLAHWGSALSDTVTKVTMVVLLIPIMLWLYRRWFEWATLAVGLLLEVCVFGTASEIVGRPRPPVEQLDGAPTNSWPSGHIAASVVFYIGLAIILWTRGRTRSSRIVAVVVGVMGPTIVTSSRLYLGMHYPTDVLGGAVLGLTALLFVRYLLRQCMARQQDESDDFDGAETTVGPQGEHPLAVVGPTPS